MSAPIADLAALLMSHGMSSDIVRQSLDLAEEHARKTVEENAAIVRQSPDIVRQSYDTSYDRKKEYDRNRQAEIRRLKRLSEKPPLILTSLLPEEILSEERKKESSGIRARARKRLSPLPENWQPPDIAYAIAIEFGTTVPTVEPIFRDYLKSSGKLYADHDAAFCNFVRNQHKFNGQNRNGKDHGKAKYGIMEAADSLRRKVASFDGPASENLDLRDGARPVVAGLLPQR